MDPFKDVSMTTERTDPQNRFNYARPNFKVLRPISGEVKKFEGRGLSES